MVDRKASRKNVSELETSQPYSKRKMELTGVSNDMNSLNLEESKRQDRKSRQTNYTYTATKIIGRGTFGEVYQATVAQTGENVAIKKVFQDKKYKNRELQIMKELSHPCIIKLKNAFYTNGENDDQYLNLVMEYMQETVFDIMKHYAKAKQTVPMILIKLYTYQLLRALAYIHALGICHRDIKPQNLLVNTNQHILVLCDFGSAKKLVQGEPNVSYICSRFYRAPELIFGCIDYTPSIDVWSAGCVLGELLNNTPLFPGESGVDQLVEIIKVLGTPTKEQIQDMNPNYNEFRFPKIKAHPWNKMFRQKTPPEAIDFISKLLIYSPHLRLKPMEALMHPFFDELRNQNCRLPNGNQLPDLFNFSKEELQQCTQEMLDELIPKWYTGGSTEGLKKGN